MTTPTGKCCLCPLWPPGFLPCQASVLTVRRKQRAKDAAPCKSLACTSITLRVTPSQECGGPVWMRNRVSCHTGVAMNSWNCRQTCFTVRVSEGGQKACQHFLACHVAKDKYPTPVQLTLRRRPVNIAPALPAERRAACQWLGPTVSMRPQWPSEKCLCHAGRLSTPPLHVGLLVDGCLGPRLWK